MTLDQIGQGLRLCRACGWNQVAEDWRVFFELGRSGAFCARRDGRVLGTSAYVRYGALAWIAMMLVDPAERRAGLGRSLLDAALQATSDAETVGLDATPSGEPLYRKLGFQAERELIRMRATVNRSRVAKCRRMEASDLAEVCRMDRHVFGACRGALLESLHARAPECAWVNCGPHGIAGYSFGRPGHLYWQIGPVVADGSETARDLVEACFPEQRVAIDVNAGDGAWLGLLREAGFAEERRFVRMYLRGSVRGIPARQFAICGPEFG